MNNKKIIHDINNHLAAIMLKAELVKAKSIIADAKKIQKLLKKLAD